MKRIIVGGYTYETDLPVEVGDTAILPTPEWLRDVKGPTWEGTVTSLESNYNGNCLQVIKIIPKK